MTSRSGEVHSHSVKERHASKKLTHGSTEAVEAEARTARSRFWTGCSNGRMSGGRLLPFESPPLGALPHPVHIHGYTHSSHTSHLLYTDPLLPWETPETSRAKRQSPYQFVHNRRARPSHHWRKHKRLPPRWCLIKQWHACMMQANDRKTVHKEPACRCQAIHNCQNLESTNLPFGDWMGKRGPFHINDPLPWF